MVTATRNRLSEDAQARVDRLISLIQSDGASGSVAVDRDFLLMDGNASLFFLHYFPRQFYTWEPINERLLDMLENERQAVAWCPGGHGKTTTIRYWLIYVMCREPQISMIYVEKNDTTAKQAARAIASVLKTNKLLIHDFGEFEGDQWSTDALTVRQRPFIADWPTLAFYGAGGSSVLGKRCNICVVDDPVTSDNSQSELERARLLAWFNEQPATAPSPLPITNTRYLRKLFLVGTTFHMDDLFHKVLEKGGYKHLHLRAVDENGDCLAPNRFCYRDPVELAESAQTNPVDARLVDALAVGRVENLLTWRKHHGTAAFLKRYQNEIIDPDAQRFSRLWFDGGTDDIAPPGGYPGCLVRERDGQTPHTELGAPRHENLTYVTGVDPAAGTQGPKTVRFACVTLGCDLKNDPNTVYLADLDFGQQPMVSDNPARESQVDIVLRHTGEYGGRVVLETNNVQGVWAQAIRQEARRRGRIVSITGHFTSNEKRIDPNLGIEAMAPMVENGYLRLPYVSASDKKRIEAMLEEFVYWGVYGTDDILMAFWFAWRALERTKRAALHRTAEMRDIPAYRFVGDRWNLPPSWTQKQVAAFFGKSVEEEVDENCG